MDEAIAFFNNLISSGYDETLSRGLSTAVLGLLKGISTLRTALQSGAIEEDELSVDVGVAADGMLMHNDILLPYWKRFTAVLSSVTLVEHKYINIGLQRIQLSKEVRDILLQSLSLKTAPVNRLYFSHNGLGEDGYIWLIEVLNSNTSLKEMYIKSNPIGISSATNLSKAAADHPKLDVIILKNCGLGQNNGLMKAVLPLLCMRVLILDGNHISSYGAELISDCLATNPNIERLCLKDNLLNDADAKKLSGSLKTNTNLKALSLVGNPITQDGMVPFFLSVYNIASFNTISDSNHICLIKFSDEEDIFGLNVINKYTNPVHNKRLKIAKALMRNIQSMSGLSYLKEDIPIELIPRLIALLGNTAAYDRLTALFKFMSEWSMPLLYTSRIGKEPRRSKRIWKKSVTLYLGKK